MKSPFPGMDPYLEEHWGDVHHRFITYACDQLQEKLPGDLRARVEERVFVEADIPVRRVFVPDVRVYEVPTPEPATALATGGTAVAEPLVLYLADEPTTQGFIEIIERSGGRVVTVVEVLSPANKHPGPGQELYLRKQAEVRSSGASLVELDFLRDGRRVLLAPEHKLPPAYRTAYRISVCRGWKSLQAEVYAVPLRKSLPTIRIPLREQDADAPLALQAIFDQCYRNGRYDDIDYRAPLDYPLDPDDARWADELLRAAGRR